MKVFLRNLTIISSAVTFSIFWQPVRGETIGNQGIRRVSVDVATGNSSSDIPLIQLAPGYGVNISFIKSGEIVDKVWLDNPAFASLDVDGCLSGLAQKCEQSGATVLHLRRINPLKIPQLPKTNSSLLTVIAKSNSGRKVYVFRVAMGDTVPKYHTVEVTPDLPEEPEIRNLPSATNITNLQVISSGLEIAQQQRLILPNSRLQRRVKSFLMLMKSGYLINDAASRSGISLRLVNRLIELGSNSQIGTLR
ncbi:hypothetical protein NIES22_56760 [Calothrix brevissima NIES-22]|nr:hypothetical protein NIES22_56760 [Calothrix brevissima NIES-22]